jgi:D-alanyl-D-alanine carboxypeptidase/D-alanyl-D-alanine-endopeptidase (penicillin-binding protein 4)
MSPRAAVVLRSLLILAALPAAPAAAQNGDVSARLARAVAEARAAKATVGAVAGRLDAAKPFFASGEKLPLVPASNQKTLTCVAAALELGLDAEIKTEFVAQGAFADGVLRGALRVRGEGDPTFGAKDFGDSLTALRAAAARLYDKGLRRVAGDLLLDDGAFDAAFVGPDWPDDAPTDRWMSGSAPLSLDEGLARIVVRPGRRAGDAAEAEPAPDTGYVRLVNRLKTVAGKKDAGVTFVRGDGDQLVAKGAARLGAGAIVHEVSVADPLMHFGYAFRAALSEKGIPVEGAVRRAKVEERRGGETWLTVRTPLSRIFPRLLKESQNHRAEMVFRHLGYRVFGLGSHENGGKALLRALGAAGVPTDGLTAADGCGLSRRNRATASALYESLRTIGRRPEAAEFREMFAEPGEDGTLERRLPALKDRLYAKTGYIDGVASLSGYLQASDGGWIVFAILLNGPPGVSLRKFADDFAEALGRL